jgi:hypothetical protein
MAQRIHGSCTTEELPFQRAKQCTTARAGSSGWTRQSQIPTWHTVQLWGVLPRTRLSPTLGRTSSRMKRLHTTVLQWPACLPAFQSPGTTLYLFHGPNTSHFQRYTNQLLYTVGASNLPAEVSRLRWAKCVLFSVHLGVFL